MGWSRFRHLGGSCAGIGCGTCGWRRSGRGGVQNAATVFASVNVVVLRLINLLIEMWEQAHAAAAALFADSFGECDAVVALGSARVQKQDFFGNFRGQFFAYGNV